MAGLSFDSKSSNSAFLSSGIFSADAIADLVFSMCSSVMCAPLASLLRFRLSIRGQFGTDALHVHLALEENVFNKRFVLDVGGIFRKGQVLDVQLILRRLGRGFFAELCRRLGGFRLVRCVLFGPFRIGGL